MAAEVEVVELASANSLLPNLTISVEADDDDDDVNKKDAPEVTAETEDQEELPGATSEKVNIEVKPMLHEFPNKVCWKMFIVKYLLVGFCVLHSELSQWLITAFLVTHV